MTTKYNELFQVPPQCPYCAGHFLGPMRVIWETSDDSVRSPARTHLAVIDNPWHLVEFHYLNINEAASIVKVQVLSPP